LSLSLLMGLFPFLFLSLFSWGVLSLALSRARAFSLPVSLSFYPLSLSSPPSLPLARGYGLHLRALFISSPILCMG
jgi:hypothetical protein